jgi:hypothetical protein
MSNPNLSPSPPSVVSSTAAAVLDDAPVVVPKVFVPNWKSSGLRSDGKQAAAVKPVSKPEAAKSSRAPTSVRKPNQAQKTPRFCRFEDHQYNREEKSWTLIADGKMRACPDKDCTFAHRVTRPTACPIGDECHDYECSLLHSKQRAKPCRFGENCINEKCTFNHPSVRRLPCPAGAACYPHAYEQQWGGDDNETPECPHSHPRRMMSVCRHNSSCRRFGCTFLHAPGAPVDCANGGQCQRQWQAGGRVRKDELCTDKHPRHTRVVEDSNGNFHFM